MTTTSIKRPSNLTIPIGDLGIGDVFTYTSNLFKKIEDGDNVCRAVDMRSGRLDTFTGMILVTHHLDITIIVGEET
jgi:hypothetical protein